MQAGITRVFSLRRHYPDQVIRVAGVSARSQPESSSTPIKTVYRFLRRMSIYRRYYLCPRRHVHVFL